MTLSKVNLKIIIFSVVTYLVFQPVIASDALSKASTATINITLAYETNHNPPRALGRGTRINWDKPGLTLELLKLVEKELNIHFNYKRMPWKRGLYFLENNNVDGIFHASFKASREIVGVYPKIGGKIDPNRAIFFQSYVLYKHKNSLLQYDGKHILNMSKSGSIGTISDYTIANDLRKRGYSVTEYNTLKANFDKLSHGETDAFAMLENMGDDYLQRNNDQYPNIIKLKKKLTFKAYYLMLSHEFVRHNKALAEKIWDVIGTLKVSPQFQSIIKKY